MSESTVASRAAAPPSPAPRPESRLDRALGSPAAFAATALILLVIFGQTFVTNPDRVAPGDDPAFYTWRTEALMSETPADLLKIKGPRDVLAGGYRVTSPIIGGLLRHVGDVHPFTYTIILTVSLRCLTALLLAGFAYRCRRDPLLFHSVAFASASLFLTPPFYGYLDNMLCLFLLASSLFFIAPSRDSWRARIVFGLFMLLSGLTHPTTTIIFFFVLCAVAGTHLLVRKLDWHSVARDDGPMLLSGFVSLVAIYAIWKIGLWGESVSLSEAAVPPPAGRGFFMDRLELWLSTMRLPLNGTLFVIGIIGLLASGIRAAAEDRLASISIVWLAPLAGVFGFLAGFAYPYYRFFNTTLAWVLLVGLGGYFVIRFLLSRSALLGVMGAIAIGLVVATNFTTNLHLWNDPAEAWLVGDQRSDLGALQLALERSGEDRPVVFVIDTEETRPTPIYGQTKFAANISRSGLPHGYLEQGHVFLGSLEDFGNAEPSSGPSAMYRSLSADTLADAQEGVRAAGKDPVVVVAGVFNQEGANTDLVESGAPSSATGQSVWLLKDGAVTDLATGENVPSAPGEAEAGLVHLLRAVLGLVLLLVPGFLLMRWALPDAGVAEGLGLVPALAAGSLALTGTLVLGVIRSPLSAGVAWMVLGLTILISSLLLLLSRRGPADPAV